MRDALLIAGAAIAACILILACVIAGAVVAHFIGTIPGLLTIIALPYPVLTATLRIATRRLESRKSSPC